MIGKRAGSRVLFLNSLLLLLFCLFLLSFFEYQLIGASAYESGIFNFGFNFYGTLSNKQQDVLSRCILVLPTVLDEFGLQLHQQLNRTFGLCYQKQKDRYKMWEPARLPVPFSKIWPE